MGEVASRAFLLFLALTFSGCGSLPLNSEAPSGFDLNGQWVINAALSDPPPDERRQQAQADRALLDTGRQGQRQRLEALAFATSDFPVLASNSMVIEQDARSMGIRYAKGAYRDVSWGERRKGLWDVRAGWTGKDLVISSRAADAAATEVMHLHEDGRRLTVTVEITSSGDSLSALRVFDRVSGQ